MPKQMVPKPMFRRLNCLKILQQLQARVPATGHYDLAEQQSLL